MPESIMKTLNHRQARRLRALNVIGILLLSLAAPVVGQKPNRPASTKAVHQSKKATDLLELAMAKSDQRIPKALLTQAVAVAVFTDVKKFGLLIEGAGTGRGVVSRRFPNGRWSAPAYIHLGAISIGLQLNASSFNVIMLFMNDNAADWLLAKKGVFFDRDKAPVAGPVGEIRTDQKEVVPVANVFSYVFDDNRLQGKDLKNVFKNFGISYDNDLNKATYGVNAADILSDVDGSKVPHVPVEVIVFSETVARYFPRE